MGFIAPDMNKQGYDSKNQGYKPKNQNIVKLKQFLKQQAKNELSKK